ncbi:IclR family transcriptional regulator [Glaciihabitans sp. INWT7]|nr:IclR family transcriptional regulator [Glaciihabitans sp. INWT7]
MPGSQRSDSPAPDYSVPALDKALDILELLAARSGGLSQAAIAEAVGRSVSQVFRVLQTLEGRGYLVREERSGLYRLSMQLFTLAHRQEPLRGLETAALPAMRAFADEVRQSCNLGVLSAGRVLVLAQVESPANFGFRVRVGSEFPLEGTATGAVLAAFGEESVTEPWLSGLSRGARDRVDRVRLRGFERADDSLQPGITDIVFPVFGRGGSAVAALTVPYVSTSFSAARTHQVEARARAAAETISGALGH